MMNGLACLILLLGTFQPSGGWERLTCIGLHSLSHPVCTRYRLFIKNLKALIAFKTKSVPVRN
jgi:hypothetical protein